MFTSVWSVTFTFNCFYCKLQRTLCHGIGSESLSTLTSKHNIKIKNRTWIQITSNPTPEPDPMQRWRWGQWQSTEGGAQLTALPARGHWSRVGRAVAIKHCEARDAGGAVTGPAQVDRDQIRRSREFPLFERISATTDQKYVTFDLLFYKRVYNKPKHSLFICKICTQKRRNKHPWIWTARAAEPVRRLPKDRVLVSRVGTLLGRRRVLQLLPRFGFMI